jgi:hypothetical protein
MLLQLLTNFGRQGGASVVAQIYRILAVFCSHLRNQLCH